MINRLSSSNKVKIVNLIDPYPDEDALKLAESKDLRIFDEFDDAIKNDNINAIILCTPNSFHMEQTINAANLGINVFCEKPLSLISSEVKSMIKVFMLCSRNLKRGLCTCFGVPHSGAACCSGINSLYFHGKPKFSFWIF